MNTWISAEDAARLKVTTLAAVQEVRCIWLLTAQRILAVRGAEVIRDAVAAAPLIARRVGANEEWL